MQLKTMTFFFAKSFVSTTLAKKRRQKNTDEGRTRATRSLFIRYQFEINITYLKALV